MHGMKNKFISLAGMMLLLLSYSFLAEAKVLRYEVLENTEMKKGGSLRPLIKPKYRVFRIKAALRDGINKEEMTERNIKDTLNQIITDIRKSEKPDAVTVFIFETKEHIDGGFLLVRV